MTEITTKEQFLAEYKNWDNSFFSDFNLCSDELRADKNIVALAVADFGEALDHASPTLQADRDIVSIAVAQSGFALTYASEELKNDIEIVLLAVSQHKNAIQFASLELQNLCKGKNPVTVLKSILLAGELKTELKAKPQTATPRGKL